MTVKIIYGADNAHKAQGVGVVIDVFRAFSTACYVVQKGAKAIIPVKTVEEAFSLKKQNPAYILMGEQNGKIIDGFDLGNSPLEIEKTKFSLKDKTVVHLTTWGTKGLKNATNCDAVITASFVNASAVVRFILERKPAIVTLICTGTNSKTKDMDEDHLCALYIKDLLQRKERDFKKIFDYLKSSRFASHFFDKKVTSHPEEDFYYCMDLDRFNFVLKLNPQGMLKKVE